MKLSFYHAIWVTFLSLLLITACVAAYFFIYGKSVTEQGPVEESFSVIESLDAVSEEREYRASGILERPLFWETRRPAIVVEKIEENPVSQQVKDPVDPFNDFKLLGVFLNNQYSGIVYKDSESSSRLAVGERIYGAWLLSKVYSTYAVFEKNSETGVLTRRFDLEYVLEPSRYAVQKDSLQIDAGEPRGNNSEGN